MAGVKKSGEYASAFPKKEKRERRKPLTPEEIKSKNNCLKTTIKKHKRLLNLTLGDDIEWTKEELEQQKLSLLPNDPKELSTKNKIKSELFCLHKRGIIKDGYIVCSDCNYKSKIKYKIGTYK